MRHVILRLVELPSELARGLGLPTGGEGPVFQRDSGEFESALRSAQSSGRVRILAEPQLVTTMGRKARLHVGGLEVEVCPHRYEAGELQLSVDFTKRISNEPLPVPAGPGKQTYPAQADLTLTPEKVAILPLDTQHDMDRWTYLLVQARPLHAGPLAAPTTDSYLPVPYVTPYGAAPAASLGTGRTVAPPTTIDPWPRKLPSEYFDQRQQIIADLTEQVRQSMQSGADEVEDVRLGFLVAPGGKSTRSAHTGNSTARGTYTSHSFRATGLAAIDAAEPGAAGTDVSHRNSPGVGGRSVARGARTGTSGLPTNREHRRSVSVQSRCFGHGAGHLHDRR